MPDLMHSKPQDFPFVLAELKVEWEREAKYLLDWWEKEMVDHQRGGFYGRIDAANQLHPDADKAVILNTRILWTFALASREFSSLAYRKIADRAYEYLRAYFIDNEFGGVFWMVDKDGAMVSGKKQVYAQAFAIYALSEYYRLTSIPAAKEMALTFFQLIEEKSLDKQLGGYWEAFDREWGPLEDLRLGGSDANEPKTMNTHLHILEAYTNLYRIAPTEEIGQATKNLILLFQERFIDESGHMHLFFDEEWGVKSHAVSYGHDIEASWLIWEALEVLGDEELMEDLKPIILKMARNTLEEGIDTDGALVNEKHANGEIDRDRIWWVQSEAMVGAMNAFRLTEDTFYLDQLHGIWDYTISQIKDHQGGEWVWGKQADGQLMPGHDKAGPWKAPYHNVRALIECISRTP
ncbi:MAG: AGE family epimerase/isomerase [Bacteroidota bacterium]